MLSILCRELLLFGEPQPWILDDARAALGGDFARFVRRARIDDYDFIRPRNGFASCANVPRFVKSDDGGGDLQDRNQRSDIRDHKSELIPGRQVTCAFGLRNQQSQSQEEDRVVSRDASTYRRDQKSKIGG